MRTAIYIRVSTDEQVREGYSIDAQKHKLLQYCNIRNWSISGIYMDEGVSGKNITERPQLKLLIDDLKKGLIENVLVYKLDRLTRNTKDLIDLMELFLSNKVEFNSINENIDTSSATGRMFIKMMGVFAEWEREVISERLLMGKEQKVRSGGKNMGPKVFGYSYDKQTKKLSIISSEAITVEKIYKLITEGYSMRKITKYLVDNKVPTSNKIGTWRVTTVQRILNYPIYCGYTSFTKDNKILFTVKTDEVPAIITEELYNETQRILALRRGPDSKTRKFSKDSYILSDVIYCAKCKRKMATITSTSWNRQRTKKYYGERYRCCNNTSEFHCTQLTVHASRLENQFKEKIIKGFLSQYRDAVTTASDQLHKINSDYQFFAEEKLRLETSIEALKKEISSYELRKKKLQDKYIMDEINSEDYKQRYQEYDADLQNVIKQYDEVQSHLLQIIEQEKLPKIYEQRIATFENILSVWDVLDNAAKKNFVSSTIKRLEVDNDQISSIEFY